MLWFWVGGALDGVCSGLTLVLGLCVRTSFIMLLGWFLEVSSTNFGPVMLNLYLFWTFFGLVLHFLPGF